MRGLAARRRRGRHLVALPPALRRPDLLVRAARRQPPERRQIIQRHRRQQLQADPLRRGRSPGPARSSTSSPRRQHAPDDRLVLATRCTPSGGPAGYSWQWTSGCSGMHADLHGHQRPGVHLGRRRMGRHPRRPHFDRARSQLAPHAASSVSSAARTTAGRSTTFYVGGSAASAPPTAPDQFERHRPQLPDDPGRRHYVVTRVRGRRCAQRQPVGMSRTITIDSAAPQLT